MSFFSRFFRRTPTDATSADDSLEVLVERLTPESVPSVYRSTSGRDTKLRAAFATWLLYLAGKFATGLRKMLDGVPHPDDIKRPAYPYDAIVVEATAFCLYTLMQEFLGADYEEEDADPSDGDYLEHLKHAAAAASAFITGKVAFSIPEDLLLKRCIDYATKREQRKSTPAEGFINRVLAAFQNGAPVGPALGRFEGELMVTIATNTYFPIFESTYMQGMEDMARKMLLAHQSNSL